MGFRILSTGGTKRFLETHGIDSDLILKVHEGRPNIVDAIKNRVASGLSFEYYRLILSVVAGCRLLVAGCRLQVTG